MPPTPSTIALDGPAASGKSTVGQRVAEALGFLFLDTGAMYRVVTLLALGQGLALADGVVLGALAEETPIEIEPPAADEQDGRQYTVRVAGEDVTWDIRHHLVDHHVSEVSAHAAVREALKEQQRRIGQRGRVVMVGRDIGTVVMPDAPLKVFLDASTEERARRRHAELVRRGQPADFDAMLAALQERDRRDTTRAEAPLRAADDAVVLHSDGRSVDEVVAAMMELAAARGLVPG